MEVVHRDNGMVSVVLAKKIRVSILTLLFCFQKETLLLVLMGVVGCAEYRRTPLILLVLFTSCVNEFERCRPESSFGEIIGIVERIEVVGVWRSVIGCVDFS
jgi:hypothetical protein